MSSEYEFLPVEVAEASIRQGDTEGWRAEASRRGFTPVLASRTHYTFADDDPCAPSELPDQQPELWMAHPDSHAFFEMSMLDGHLCAEMLTTLTNGARLFSVLMNEALEPHAENIVPWEEAGNYVNLVRSGGLDALFETHAAGLARMIEAEGAQPASHATPDDVLLTKRNNNRHADNWGWSQSLGAFVPPELPHDPEELREIAEYLQGEGDPRSVDDIVASLANPPPRARAQNLAQRRMAIARDERLKSLMVARHSVDDLATWPTHEPTVPGRHPHWRNWTDDEMEASQSEDPRAEAELQKSHMAAYIEALAEVMEQPPPDPADLARYADATMAMMQAGMEQIDPESDEAAALMAELQAAVAAFPWLAELPDEQEEAEA